MNEEVFWLRYLKKYSSSREGEREKGEKAQKKAPIY
jgi:hypothetical protein